jgi:hypothetical protein
MTLQYPGADLTIKQLLYALQQKLENETHATRLSKKRALVENTVSISSKHVHVFNAPSICGISLTLPLHPRSMSSKRFFKELC